MSALSTSLIVRSLMAVGLAAMCSCTTPSAPVTATPRDLPSGAWWLHRQLPGSAQIIISLDEQRVALLKGGQPVGLSPISSGREGHDTRPGRFRISEKDANHRSSLYGAYVDGSGLPVMEDVDVRKDAKPPGTRFLGADMKWFMRVNGAVGMHQGYLPGYPASHGCIRLPGTMASLFYHATPLGTPVEIRQNAGLLELSVPPGAMAMSESRPKPAALAASSGHAVKAKPTRRAAPGQTLYWDGGN